MATSLQLRNAVARLSGLAQADVRSLFAGEPSPETLKVALVDVVPALVAKYGTAAGALAAEWYDLRRARAEVRGRYLADPVVVPAAGAEALAGFAVGPLYQANRDYAAARVLLDGGLQRRIANVARETVMTNSVRDPRARGWQRVGDGSSCEFCSMLLGRGAVYTEATADFQAHDHCGCSAEPAWS